MPGFRENADGTTSWLSWEGDPDDDAAHQTILTWLQGAVTAGFLEPTEPLSNAVKGNLGEFIAYRIGESYVFTNVTMGRTLRTPGTPSRRSPGQTLISYGCTLVTMKLTIGQHFRK